MPHRMIPPSRALSSAVLLLSITGSATAQFVKGDVYLVSTGVPNPGASCASTAIVRITMNSGWRSNAIDRPSSLNGRACYDPFRQRIVAGRDANAPPMLIASDGSETYLPGSGANRFALVASRGDGLIYTWGTSQLSFYDASNTLQSVLNVSGAGAYQFVTSGVVGAMAYDASTNAIFFASALPGNLTEVARVPLNASGTQVAGAATTITFDASTGNLPQMPVGFSRGPNGTLFLKIDDTTSNSAGRMRLITPATMASAPFATSAFFGAGGETAGIYVPAIDQAVVLDTSNNAFKTFGPADSATGTTIVPMGIGVSGCGSGEAAQLIIVEEAASIVAPTCYANCDGSTTTPVLTAADFTCFLSKFRAGNPSANCDGSTTTPVLTAADFTCFLTKFRAGCA